MHALPDNYGIEILRSEVGSTLHGTGLPGGEDHDEMGIFVELPATTVGLQSVEQYIWRSAGEGNRSQPGDTDLTVYSLRKWARLALRGNPTVLLILFAPADKVELTTPAGAELRTHADWFASKRAGQAFLGYMQQQRHRMAGERGKAGRVRVTPDGEVDWKYAMHMLRLGHQGVEYLETGRITLPIPGDVGAHLRAVRRGDLAFGDVIAEAESLERRIGALLADGSPLPDEPQRDTVERWVIAQHLDAWAGLADTARA
jgi:predicted nucleotidyltransferase